MFFISRLYSLCSGYKMTHSYIRQANSWSLRTCRDTSHPQQCICNTVSPTPPAEDRRNRPVEWCLSGSCSSHIFRLRNIIAKVTTHVLSLSRLLSRLVWRQSWVFVFGTLAFRILGEIPDILRFYSALFSFSRQTSRWYLDEFRNYSL